jgi:hypothetical protein
MGRFRKQPRTLVPADTLNSLAAYGEVVLDARRAGRPVTDPRFDCGPFLGPVQMTMINGDRDRVIEELYEAAINAPDRDRATVGAYRVLAEFSPTMEDHRFLRLCDASLDHMGSAG